jgi:hypothetical protein
MHVAALLIFLCVLVVYSYLPERQSRRESLSQSSGFHCSSLRLFAVDKETGRAFRPNECARLPS